MRRVRRSARRSRRPSRKRKRWRSPRSAMLASQVGFRSCRTGLRRRIIPGRMAPRCRGWPCQEPPGQCENRWPADNDYGATARSLEPRPARLSPDGAGAAIRMPTRTMQRAVSRTCAASSTVISWQQHWRRSRQGSRRRDSEDPQTHDAHLRHEPSSRARAGRRSASWRERRRLRMRSEGDRSVAAPNAGMPRESAQDRQLTPTQDQRCH